MNYDHFVCNDFEEQCQLLEHAQQFWAPQPPSLSFSQLPSFSSLSPSPLPLDHKNHHKNHLNDNNTIITTANSAEQQQNHQLIAFRCERSLHQQLDEEIIIPSFRFVHQQAKAKASVPFYGAPTRYRQHQPEHDELPHSHNIDLSHNPMTDCFDELFGGDDDDENMLSDNFFYFGNSVDPSTTVIAANNNDHFTQYMTSKPHHQRQQQQQQQQQQQLNQSDNNNNMIVHQSVSTPIRFDLLFAPPTTTTTTTHSHDNSHSSHHHHHHHDFPMINKGFSFPRPPSVPTTISYHEQHQLQPTNGLTDQLYNNNNDNPKVQQQWNMENNHGDIR